jgi:hypothetical protein
LRSSIWRVTLLGVWRGFGAGRHSSVASHSSSPSSGFATSYRGMLYWRYASPRPSVDLKLPLKLAANEECRGQGSIPRLLVESSYKEPLRTYLSIYLFTYSSIYLFIYAFKSDSLFLFELRNKFLSSDTGAQEQLAQVPHRQREAVAKGSCSRRWRRILSNEFSTKDMAHSSISDSLTLSRDTTIG